MADMVRKATAFEIVNHWVLAVSFFILTITGFGFLFHLEQLNAVFGSYSQVKLWHNWAGVAFSVSLLISLFFYLPVSLSLGADDIAWFQKGGGYLSKKGAALPPQDRLNSGQKLFYLFLVLAGITIGVSGFVIWLTPMAKDWVLLSHLLHNISFDLMVAAIVVHIYLATAANPGTFRIMVYGTVPIAWAKKRHAKWVSSLGMQ